MGKGLLLVSILFLALVLSIFIIVLSLFQPRSNIETAEDLEKTFLTKDVSYIVSINAYTAPGNWDADAETDGIWLYITFNDRQGNPIYFSDTEYQIKVKIFLQELDSNFNLVKGELIYQNTFDCVSSGRVSPLSGGIRIYFWELSPYEGDFGIMEVEVEIPGVGTFYGKDETLILY